MGSLQFGGIRQETPSVKTARYKSTAALARQSLEGVIRLFLPQDMWLFISFILLLPSLNCKVLQVFVLWRHGDRAPGQRPYPNDPYNETFWPRGWDQLTEEGMRQTHALGTWLRHRYVLEEQLLSPHFNREEILFRSSNADRAIESAQAVAAGLYPLEGSKIWRSATDPVRWQPVPIYTSAYGVEDPLLRPTGVKCPLAKAIVKKETASLADSINSRYAQLFRKLENYSGYQDISFQNVKSLHGMHIEMLHGLSQPHWIGEIWNGSSVLDHLHELKRITRLSIFDTREKARLRGGVLLNDWAAHLETSARGLRQRRALMYSAHDGTINSVMYTLGVGNHRLVPYATALLTELHEVDNLHYVKILYKNETERAYTLTLPNCMELCPLKAFLNEIADVRIENLLQMKELCNSSMNTQTLIVFPALLVTLFGWL